MYSFSATRRSQRVVAGQIDDAEAAFAEHAGELELAQVGADRQRVAAVARARCRGRGTGGRVAPVPLQRTTRTRLASAARRPAAPGGRITVRSSSSAGRAHRSAVRSREVAQLPPGWVRRLRESSTSSPATSMDGNDSESRATAGLVAAIIRRHGPPRPDPADREVQMRDRLRAVLMILAALLLLAVRPPRRNRRSRWRSASTSARSRT